LLGPFRNRGDKGTVASKQKFRVALAAALALASFGEFASAQGLPNDVKHMHFRVTELPGWFEAGRRKGSSAVKPADSLNFLATCTRQSR
jgi:hypothetical protein